MARQPGPPLHRNIELRHVQCGEFAQPVIDLFTDAKPRSCTSSLHAVVLLYDRLLTQSHFP
jgi:hypothetical protein